MTPQEIFDKAYIGVVTQGQPSVKVGKGCVYRGENGNKCAIGHLIDDATAKRWDKYEMSGIGSVSIRAKIKPDWLDANIKLLENIQAAHDNTYLQEWQETDFVEDYKKQMGYIARENNLTIPEMSA